MLNSLFKIIYLANDITQLDRRIFFHHRYDPPIPVKSKKRRTYDAESIW